MICIHHISYINHIRRPHRAPRAHALRASRRTSRMASKRHAHKKSIHFRRLIRYLIECGDVIRFNIPLYKYRRFKFPLDF